MFNIQLTKIWVTKLVGINFKTDVLYAKRCGRKTVDSKTMYAEQLPIFDNDHGSKGVEHSSVDCASTTYQINAHTHMS